MAAKRPLGEKLDGNVVPSPDFEPLASEDGTLGQGDAADGHKGNNMGGADTRMNTALGSQID